MTKLIADAEVVREYGPFAGVEAVHGLTFDGQHVWFASGAQLNALDPDTGTVVRKLDVPAHAGTTFDGTHLWQIAESKIQKIEPATGRVVATIPTPEGGAAGLAWAEGSLWVGQHRARKIHQVDPATGAILRSIESNRFVTGVTWVDGELWHGVMDDDGSELRQIDAKTGAVNVTVAMPKGTICSGLESNGADLLFAGGGKSGTVRAIRRPARRAAKIAS